MKVTLTINATKHEIESSPSETLLAAERFWRSEQFSQWLKEGYLVLADRFYLSGMVYCGAEGVSFEKFSSIHQGVLKPHLYIYLELPLVIAFQRRGKARDKWEEADLFREAARLYPEALDYVRANDAADICVIDAAKPRIDILQQAFLCISQKAHLK